MLAEVEPQEQHRPLSGTPELHGDFGLDVDDL